MIIPPAAVCDFASGSFLVIGPNVGPLQYYSHLPTIIISLLLGIFVLIKNPRSVAHQALFWMIISFVLWVFFDSVIWATNRSDVIMFMWSLQILIEPLVYIGALYLLYALIKGKAPSFTNQLSWILLFAPLIVLVPTKYVLSGFDLYSCLAEETFLSYYSYLIEFFYLIWIIGFSITQYRVATTSRARTEIIILTLGVIFLLFAFSYGNIVGSYTGDWQLAQYGLFGMPIFTGFLVYSIVRFGTFNIKLIGVVALVVAIGILNLSLLFVKDVQVFRGVAITTFILGICFGIILIRSVKREISQRERIEGLAKELAKANQRLRELDKAKSEFVALASHQLRSPLTAIRGYASMILEEAFGKVPEKMIEPLQRIDQSTKYMSLSVDDFLNISRIESGQMKYESSVFSLKDLAESIVNELKPAAVQKGLELSFRSECQTAGNIKADVGKIRQVLQNLIDNSMKYTPKGTVTVVACDDNHHGKASVAITDTGVGMSEETKNAIFQKFVRAKNANTVNVQGTGLGLYIGKQMTEAMGGTITPLSEGEGKGSTFILEMPLVS